MASREKSVRSRRGIIAEGVHLLALTALFAAGARAANKLSQKIAGYQDQPKGGHQCSMCAHFQPPSSCNIVDGTISPRGWCKMFSPKMS
jgi:hypothetical protein